MHQNWEGNLSDFEHGVAAGATEAGLSISETVDLLGFSYTTTSRVDGEKAFSYHCWWQFSG